MGMGKPDTDAMSIDAFDSSDVEDGVLQVSNAESIHKATTPKPKIYFNYRSLINPESKVKKFLNRLDPDTFSLFSPSSRAQVPLANIDSLPLEVLKHVFSYIDDHKTQVCCLYVNSHFYQAAKIVVYEEPFLTSSYRVAQLITSLKEFNNGHLVKRLDLSNLSPGVITKDLDDSNRNGDGDNDAETIGPEILEYALASWRDWKFRNDPLYGSSMLNSYNLSKSKSTISCESTISVGSSLHRILSKWKFLNQDYLEVGRVTDSMKKKIYKWKKKLKRKASIKVRPKKNPSVNEPAIPSTGKPSVKSVNFSTLRDPKNQPFASPHPYTNKFLLKYAGLKDLPIGYILYFIDMCPNLREFNLSQVTLSSDFAIVNMKSSKISSLIEDVLSDDESADEVARYLSDANVYFNIKSYQNEFIKLYELDVLKSLVQLEKLEKLDLGSLTWLNYKNVRLMVQELMCVKNGNLKWINFTNSGMLKDLKWAREFGLEELKEYFKDEVEKVEVVENQYDVLARTVGMNY